MLSRQEVCLLCGLWVEGGLYSPHHFKYAQSGLLTHSPTVNNYTLSVKRVTLELNSYFSCHNCWVAYLAQKFLQSLKSRCFARTYAQCITQKNLSNRSNGWLHGDVYLCQVHTCDCTLDTHSGISGNKSDPVYIAIRFELGNVTKQNGVNEQSWVANLQILLVLWIQLLFVLSGLHRCDPGGMIDS